MPLYDGAPLMDPAYIEQYRDLELRHWWWVARRELISRLIQTYCFSGAARPRWLDVGCSTGVLLESIPEIPDKVGVELDEGSRQVGLSRGLDIRSVGIDWNLKALGRFDLVTLCDVLEHVENEAKALAAGLSTRALL